MKSIIFIITIILTHLSFGQIPKGRVQDKYYEYCHQNLSKLVQSEVYPYFATNELCSIKKCFRGISYPEINEIIYKRIVELAQLNFEKKIYLYLVEGNRSVERAEKENENLQDDNRLIYISVDDFINAKEITKGKDLYNTETERLTKRK
ncbi:hypothetical protein SAMN05444372_10851 [Flavobacterium micromati]|uniref:Uncharacterized protein n=1 Tax=Flavobacterium micromati TaxID=229205 RepID=A0A1M5LF82_9FLAO|nr:hypothetical protein [Flavobacterium micromati]SHG63774.1 hypothetical protein SAMN05444372_10851 [Flavobacterium micromati]